MSKRYKIIIVAMLYIILSGCLGMPKNIKPIEGFEVKKYLGKWYEIARLDHSFERGMSNVTAEYSQRKDGGITVINRGYLEAKARWKSAQGKAFFVEDEKAAYLKVSFFGPFYGSYVVFSLDQVDYQYAFVTGLKKSYLWFLSRTPMVSQALKQQFIQQTRELGFDTDELIWVKHSAGD